MSLQQYHLTSAIHGSKKSAKSENRSHKESTPVNLEGAVRFRYMVKYTLTAVWVFDIQIPSMVIYTNFSLPPHPNLL
jgi:hypothetical protein